MNTSKNYEVKKILKGKKSKGISNSQENLKSKEIPSKKPGRPKKVTIKEIFGTTQNTDPNVNVNTPKKKSPIKSKESSKKRGRPKKAKNIEELNQNDIFVLTEEESPKKTKKKCFHEEIETKENQTEEEFSNQEVEEFFKRIFSQNEQENIGIQFKNELASQIEILNSIQQLLFEEEYIDEDLNNLNESIKFF